MFLRFICLRKVFTLNQKSIYFVLEEIPREITLALSLGIKSNIRYSGDQI